MAPGGIVVDARKRQFDDAAGRTISPELQHERRAMALAHCGKASGGRWRTRACRASRDCPRAREAGSSRAQSRRGHRVETGVRWRFGAWPRLTVFRLPWPAPAAWRAPGAAGESRCCRSRQDSRAAHGARLASPASAGRVRGLGRPPPPGTLAGGANRRDGAAMRVARGKPGQPRYSSSRPCRAAWSGRSRPWRGFSALRRHRSIAAVCHYPEELQDVARQERLTAGGAGRGGSDRRHKRHRGQ